jgi:hypothetical protein
MANSSEAGTAAQQVAEEPIGPKACAGPARAGEAVSALRAVAVALTPAEQGYLVRVLLRELDLTASV